ncbi:histidine-containing phosphotransfer protein 2-like [Hordeum vulgare subsp. vulgare]|uniref:Histidine-containing phosphotransfer protein n=1 Tax=Hordeum vulgare subsp. vulgare TaxID=112509 RepID=A0A8I6XE93_HORVV|nr:histidine-containing phosphotransfer protein 2-like [Hordeum vulgare subsp. vulgare]
MALVSLKARLNTLLAIMYASGTLDKQFRRLRSMEEDGSAPPGFVADAVSLFIRDADRILTDIAGLMKQPVVDVDEVDALVRRLQGSCSSIGAKKLNVSCTYFRRFYEAKCKGCLFALAVLRNEFYDVRNKFQTMMHLEQQIEACSPKLSDNN